MDKTWDIIPSDSVIEQTAQELTKHNIQTEVFQTGEEAKKRVFQLIPEGAVVMPMTSVTLDTLGIADEINTSGKYDSVRQKLLKMDPKTEHLEMNKLASAPEWTIGSVHAVTEDGHVLIASRSGSQLPAYVYGAGHVIWVVGAQKIVKNIDEGMKRLYDYVLGKESERVKIAYGLPHSEINKILIDFAEPTPDRVHLLLVKQQLGF